MLLRLLRAIVLPFRWARLAVYYVSYVVAHPIALAIVAVLLWRSSYTRTGHDNAGFVVSLIAYLALIAAPARAIRNYTRLPPRSKSPDLPKETPWPAPVRATLAVPMPSDDVSPSEAEMWARIDPFVRRVARAPTSRSQVEPSIKVTE